MGVFWEKKRGGCRNGHVHLLLSYEAWASLYISLQQHAWYIRMVHEED